MRNLFRASPLIVAAVLTSSSAGAQVRIGSIDLALGAPRDSALALLRSEHSLDSVTSSPAVDEWLIWSGERQSRRSDGVVKFRAGRLSFASRSWTPLDQRDGASIANAVIGALKTLARSNEPPCVVVPTDASAPDYQNESVEIQCGNHYVSISASRIRGGISLGISEAWHRYPDRK
jgi:hypothetical protein